MKTKLILLLALVLCITFTFSNESYSKVKAIKEKSFNEKVIKASKEKLIVVDFFATWCGPCKMIKPIIEKISKKRKDITIYKCDVDVNPNLGDKYASEGIPTLVFFKDGQVVDQIIGAANEAVYLEKIDQLVTK